MICRTLQVVVPFLAKPCASSLAVIVHYVRWNLMSILRPQYTHDRMALGRSLLYAVLDYDKLLSVIGVISCPVVSLVGSMGKLTRREWTSDNMRSIDGDRRFSFSIESETRPECSGLYCCNQSMTAAMKL